MRDGGGELLILQGAREKRRDASQHEEWKHRQARHAGEDHQHRREQHQRARKEQELPAQLRAKCFLGRSARDEDARRRRGDERGDLRHEAVTDGEQGETLERFRDRHAFLHDADGEAANDVDERDEHGGDGVAAHKLARAVHRAVEIRLLLDLAPAFARRRFVDDAGVEFRIDGHLLAGHGVQGEARRDFRDAPGALGDDDEVDHHQDEEHHHADHVIAAHDEVAERLDDVARVAVEQDEPRGGDVQREPEQRHEQEQRGEAGEIRRLLHVENHQQDQQRERDADGQEAVEQERRDRQDHQQDRAEDACGEE